jgi:penicillin amidase
MRKYAIRMRITLRILGFALVIIGLVAAGGYLWLRQSLPTTKGEIVLAGPAGPIEILRDGHGIPHIFAASARDAHFGLGFAHAQDRLWQMEASRRIGAGRLAEVAGRGALEADRFMRTLGARRAAAANLKRYDADTLAMLEAYAAGVNAFLATNPVLPPEFWILGAPRPEPWTPLDSVAWTKLMAWDLGGNWRNELLRLRLARTLPVAQIQEFLAPYPGDPAVALPDLRKLYGELERPPTGVASNRLDHAFEGVGSKAWVIAGERSATGKPFLANDPHLGLTAPPVWYFAHLNAPGLDVIGATLPGVPGVVVGRNDRIAWGFTNTGPDVQDLYLEKLDSGGRYLTPEGPRPFTVLEETIKVKGGENERLTVRVSRHGPVISDVVQTANDAAPRGHVVALAWTALAEDDLTMQAALKLGLARDWQEFLGAARDFHAPQQNAIYADVDGNIGFIAAGRVPLRKSGNDLRGLAPAPGWDARYDWNGYLPFDELPRRYNPPEGTIHNANQKIVSPNFPRHITYEWQPPYRAWRIAELLAATPKHDVAASARMQADIHSAPVRELVARGAALKPRSEEARQALALLAGWDGTMTAQRPEPLIATAWWRELARAIYADELGDAFRANWSPRAVFVLNVLQDADGQSRWCDDVRTRPVETCADQLVASLEAALAGLRERHGRDMRRWKWGDAHQAHHRHRPFSRVPWLALFFDIRVPSPGDAYTVNVGSTDMNDENEPFANRHAASLRAIHDLANPQASLFIHSAGQSGNLLSPHYRSFADAWARGDYVPMITERKRLEADRAERLVLAPRK